ncbi:sensor histidine kinase [Cohnella nanjingensis]|uniref:histidine kinase n=1 Tax=Cohnella nanjingensis TaxID=1387779 RepID=A0A7X0RQN4_9BACL|nr:sensor histidine kinase [Cohnella nanjingensis]MBB6671922.1 sensor histidine kinase [Cohnella nanjingensis]
MRKWLMLAPLLLPFFYLLWPKRLIGFELILFLIFAAGYRQSYVDAKRREMYIIVQIIAISIMAAVANPWLVGLGLHPAISMSWLSSYRRISGMAGFMLASFCGTLFLFDGGLLSVAWRHEWLPLILALAAVPYILKLYQMSCEVKSKLRDANDEIARLIKNEERQRIARDLHDTLGHQLSLITLKSELVERLIAGHPNQALEEARDVQQISRSTLLQVRELISDMQSIDIGEEFRQAEEIFQSAGIAFEGVNRSSLAAVPIIQNILGMCLRECVTNVIKHSGADRCKATLCEEPGQYMLHVQDNGTGMARDSSRLEQFGNGLLGMKERLLLIEGKLELVSDQAWGTRVSITVPKIAKPNIAEVVG